jgi:hypothetical protein
MLANSVSSSSTDWEWGNNKDGKPVDRDVRLVSIGGGADEIMLGIICKLMGILPGKKK